ncbi:oligopeptide ABC transporter, periplasmic oligopeptide-binding protein OppA [Geomicrobium sp. JCM 19037]|uniref:ABC transporter substrate-binding protein n=1 Tax=unclassified Geomicrobium TaxID=2628951 RepID=UPI00045F250A|nr:ABC transporter substrate-binding protein [Geomicrobium sp. JCM 19037]GAK06264.1 oligopeptide ABC transporter, periplasmic oligopeptide-binding protein OppA [Geomicrobium sp. JCM 19037]
MKKHAWMIAFAPVALLSMAACGNGGDGDEAASSEIDEDIEMDVDEDSRDLTIALGTDIVTFDIHDHNNTSTEAVHVNMFDYLVQNDHENEEFIPKLAEDYELVDDYTWSFTLREGVTFHNGDPLTSEDVKYTLERVATDESLQEHSLYNVIEEVEVIDELNFNIITAEPEPILLNRLSRIGSGILPSEYIEENGWDHFLENPIGTGEFQFVEWARDDRVVFEAYEDYWNGQNEEWDTLTFRIIPENSTRVAELLTGGVDIAVNVPPSEWERIEDADGVSLMSESSNRVLMLMLRNTEGYPTSDPLVREAIDLAIDNEAIIESILMDAGTATRTRVTPGNNGANEDLYETNVYDIDRALELMAEAGYEEGFDMTLHSPRGRYLQDTEVAELVAGMLAAINVNVNLEFMEWSNFVDLRQSGSHEDSFMIGFGNSMADADNALDRYYSTESEGEHDYVNAEVDELLDAARQNMDLDERAEQHQRVQEIIAEERPDIYLHQESINVGVNDRLNYTPTFDEMFYVDTITRN